MEHISPYALFEVVIGEGTMRARPIEWNGEIIDNEGHLSSGSLAKPTAYETTCHGCGQMIIFRAGFSSIQCPHCGCGEDIRMFDPDTDLNDDDIIQLDNDIVSDLLDFVENDSDTPNSDPDNGDNDANGDKILDLLDDLDLGLDSGVAHDPDNKSDLDLDLDVDQIIDQIQSDSTKGGDDN